MNRRLLILVPFVSADFAFSQSPEVIRCEAELVDFQSEFLWRTELPALTFDSETLPLATLEIRWPENHSGKRLRILFDSMAPWVIDELSNPKARGRVLILPMSAEQLAEVSRSILVSSDLADEVIIVTSGGRY